MQKILDTLVKQLNPQNTQLNEPLSKHTTLKIGGKADIFYEAHDLNDFINTIKLAKLQNIPVTIIGRGSNVLISDKGIRGLVIKNFTKTIKITGEKPIHEDKVKVDARWETDSSKGTFKGIEMKDIDYDESDKPRIEVIMDSGVDLPFAINYLISKGITGLQWFSGIPGTIGGAIFNNIHGGSHMLSEVLSKVKILNKELEVKELNISKLGMDYDKSRFHKSGEIILQGIFNLYKGNKEKAKFTATEWAKRKRVQPRNSAGCTFANITQKQKDKLNLPTTSIGYIVEHEINLKGFHVNDAAVSEKHHNFIVNNDRATAKDYLAVMKEIYNKTKEKLGIKLIPEIILLGFKENEITEFM